jgi:hypothetical protein
MPCQCRPNAVPLVWWTAKSQFCQMLRKAWPGTSWMLRADPGAGAPDERFEPFTASVQVGLRRFVGASNSCAASDAPTTAPRRERRAALADAQG